MATFEQDIRTILAELRRRQRLQETGDATTTILARLHASAYELYNDLDKHIQLVLD